MASPAQILANQANARHSTGPKTTAGKSASSHNAEKHGLSSPFNVLAHEDQGEFNELLDCLRDEYEAASPHQAFLIDQLAITMWQVARAQRLQTKAFEHLTGSVSHPGDADMRIITAMFKTNPNALTTLQRYAEQAERSYLRAHRELQAAKKVQAVASVVPPLDPRPASQSQPKSTPAPSSTRGVTPQPCSNVGGRSPVHGADQ